MSKIKLSACTTRQLIRIFHDEVGVKVDTIYVQEFKEWVRQRSLPKRATGKRYHAWLVRKAKAFYIANQ